MRKKVTAGLLALFLGGFGIHRFYLGQTFLGIVYLIFSFTFVPFILSILDAFLLFIMPQGAFDAKYNQEIQVKNRTRQHKSWEADTKIKARHKVKGKNSLTSKERTQRAKQKIRFKKYWENGKKAFKDYQFNDAEEAYINAMEISGTHADLLFDLACLYSMTEQTSKGFEYLELSVQSGFSDLERIEKEPALAFLRIQDSFLDFAKAGYKRKKNISKDKRPELLEQLRQLDKRKNRGLLTDLEYEIEKKKLDH